MQKRENLNEKMAEISARFKLLEELKEKKAQIVESINNKALHKAKQLTLSKKVIYYKIFIFNYILCNT